MTMNRNPVLWYTSIMAGGAVLASSADFANLISPTVLKWFLVVYGVAGAAGGVWVRSQVTPLADPRGGEDGKQPLIVDPDPAAKAKRDAGVT
jgi:hypothetical protein